jgi:hypothetical protein
VPTPPRTRAAAIVTTRIFLNSALPCLWAYWPHRPELPPGSPRQISRATCAFASPNRGEIGGRGATGFTLIADERCRRLPVAPSRSSSSPSYAAATRPSLVDRPARRTRQADASPAAGEVVGRLAAALLSSRPCSRLCQRGGVPASSSPVARGGFGTQPVCAPSISARRLTSACIASRKRPQSARNSSETKSPGRLGVRAPGGVSGCSFGPGITSPPVCGNRG